MYPFMFITQITCQRKLLNSGCFATVENGRVCEKFVVTRSLERRYINVISIGLGYLEAIKRRIISSIAAWICKKIYFFPKRSYIHQLGVFFPLYDFVHKFASFLFSVFVFFWFKFSSIESWREVCVFEWFLVECKMYEKKNTHI